MADRKNKIELLGFYGDDATIACSAWTSTSRELTEKKRARIGKLINMLWNEGHETPFEKGVIHFLVDTEIASHIHFLKHRISSLNAESARYKELKEDKYYIPEDWIGIDTHIDYRIDCGQFTAGSWADALEKYTKLGNLLYHQCVTDLEPVLGRKRAKESARFFKTYNSQIQADVMFNMRSFANFIKLRNSEHAQLEIREAAAEMLRIVTEIAGEPFKETLKVFERRLELENRVKELVKVAGDVDSAILAIKMTTNKIKDHLE
jgi:flavin-dependent thymidylate synthase